MIDDKELAQLFKAESEEHLARLDSGLLQLEKTPTDQPLLEAVFRASHSLKGAARMLGLSGIEAAAHGLETLLNTARHGESLLMPETLARMTVMLGGLRERVAAECGMPGQADIGQPNPGQSNPGQSNPGQSNPGQSNPGPAHSPVPDPVACPVSSPIPSPVASPVTGTPSSDVPQSPASVLHTTPHTPKPNATQFRIDTVRVLTRKLDDLLTLVGELAVIEGRTQHRLSLMDELLEKWALLKSSADRGGAQQRAADFGRLLNEVRDAMNVDSARMGSSVSALEDRVHAIRLLPLSTVFELFPRMVHDLAAEQGKEVELVIEGGDIAVDKRILEEMKDPLMHLVRNALDHGIEAPDERERQGKHRCGRLWLRARQENNSVLLEVGDDGNGLDMASIRKVAAQRGLYDAATLAAMPHAQLQQLIFLSGFTTRDYITELSGRGVGLDVVRVNVEHLKGEIRIDSTPHQGTAMQVRLPLSLVTSRLLIVAVGGHRYGVPIEFVHSARRLPEGEVFTFEGRAAFELAGQVVIAPRLCDLLGLVSTGSETVCIVLECGDERLGLRVDELLDEQDVLTKPLGAPLLRVRNVSGLVMLSSGEVCVVLNPLDLVRTAHRPDAGLGVPEIKAAMHLPDTPYAARRVLLVEDSALVRAMETRILEEAGYEVVTATDGVEGLEALALHAFSAVVSDINMPNMDGLAMTARIRQEARYQDLPVILVTTLSSDADKRRGLEVGANAYLMKHSFDQRVLLDTLKRLI